MNKLKTIGKKKVLLYVHYIIAAVHLLYSQKLLDFPLFPLSFSSTVLTKIFAALAILKTILETTGNFSHIKIRKYQSHMLIYYFIILFIFEPSIQKERKNNNCNRRRKIQVYKYLFNCKSE